MQALILAGGKGTRLRPLTVHTPKPVVPICNRPFLLYQLDILRRAGIKNVTLSLSYQPGKIEQQLHDGSEYGVRLSYRVEPQPMGTAGAFKFAEDLIRDRTVVFNGDILTDLDLEAVIFEHEKRNATATIVLTPVPNPSAYGLVETESDGKVLRFLEKPKADEIRVNTINAGTYILEPAVLDLIPAGKNQSFEYDLFPELLRRGEAFYAHKPKDGYWLDIGTPERYLQAHEDLISGATGRIKHEKRRGDFEGAGAEIDELSVIDDECIIKPGARINSSVLGRGCHIEEEALVENSVIWPHTQIGAGALIRGAIIGHGCHIGRFGQVSPGTMLGDKSSITDYTRTGADV